MQIVVAQQTQQGTIGGLAAAQHGERSRAAVHQIAQQQRGIAAGRKIDLLQQAFQRLIAALQVAYTVKCHRVLAFFGSMNFLIIALLTLL